MLFCEIEHRDFRDTLARCVELGGADLIFTSPPYPDARPGQYGGDAHHDFSWEDYQALGDAVYAALRPGGFCGIVIDGPVRFWRSKEIGSERSLIAFKLAIDWAERVGLRYVEHCAYARLGAPGQFGPRWRSGWEPVHLFQRPGSGHFNRWGISHERKTDNHNYSGALRHGGRIIRYAGRTTRIHHRRMATTLIDVGAVGCRVTDAEHPAPYDERLADAFVLCYPPPGGLVCDPFTGSGTTGISAAKHGRRFVGGDLGCRERDGRRWADIAAERCREIIDPAQQRLF